MSRDELSGGRVEKSYRTPKLKRRASVCPLARLSRYCLVKVEAFLLDSFLRLYRNALFTGKVLTEQDENL
jgi:hypothetical protein